MPRKKRRLLKRRILPFLSTKPRVDPDDDKVQEVLVYKTYGKDCPKGRSIPKGYNRHHRRAKSRGGSTTWRGYNNIAVVPIQEHHSFNSLFGSNPLVQDVVRILNNTWIEPDKVIRFYYEDRVANE